MKLLFTAIQDWLLQETQKHEAILLPLRLFIGLGWVRSSVEKIVEPDWHNGIALNQFFAERIAASDVAFPFYQSLMEGAFSTYAPFLGKLIMVGEFYCGLAILFGLLTRTALVAGLFMNFNFILAGSVSPSAFYIVIQSILLPSAVGRVFGLDSLFYNSPNLRYSMSQPVQAFARIKRILCLGGSLLSGLLALRIIPYISSFDPAHSIEDPVMLLSILFSLQSLLLLILGVRSSQLEKKQPLLLGRATSQPVQEPIPEVIGSRAYVAFAITEDAEPIQHYHRITFA